MLRWETRDNEGGVGVVMSPQHWLDNETLFGRLLLKNRNVYNCSSPEPAHTHRLPGMTLLCGWLIGMALGQDDQGEGQDGWTTEVHMQSHLGAGLGVFCI